MFEKLYCNRIDNTNSNLVTLSFSLNLYQLKISNIQNIKNMSILIQGVQNLKSISIGYSELSSVTISNMEQLEYLKIHRNNSIDELNINNCKNLEYAIIYGVKQTALTEKCFLILIL